MGATAPESQRGEDIGVPPEQAKNAGPKDSTPCRFLGLACMVNPSIFPMNTLAECGCSPTACLFEPVATSHICPMTLVRCTLLNRPLQSAFPMHSTDHPAKRLTHRPVSLRFNAEKEAGNSDTRAQTKHAKAREAMHRRERETIADDVAAMGHHTKDFNGCAGLGFANQIQKGQMGFGVKGPRLLCGCVFEVLKNVRRKDLLAGVSLLLTPSPFPELKSQLSERTQPNPSESPTKTHTSSVRPFSRNSDTGRAFCVSVSK